MNILVLNGSPRIENTSAMVAAFKEGAEKAGHQVEEIQVGKMSIAGCKACQYCHTKGEGKCIQKDDMDLVYPSLLEADMLIIASPIYYLALTSQMSAALQRVFCVGKPPKVKKMGLLLSSGGPNTWDSAISEYKGIAKFYGAEDMGIITAFGEENKSEEKMNEIKAFAEKL